MLETLYEAERLLPRLLLEEAAWTGLYADTEKPPLQRLWRQWGDRRIYLHRFQGCAPEEAFPHPHPWPFAVRILEGRYEMGVGASADPATVPPDVARVILGPGCCYEMAHHEGWHWIRPLGDESVTLMVAGPPNWRQNRVRANRPVRELTPDERRFLFDLFRVRYPHS